MKKGLYLLTIAAALFTAFGLSSCKEKEESVEKPADLTVSQITSTSAILAWSGSATSYEVVVGDADAVAVTGKSHTVTGLTPATKYTWKVRANDGGNYSGWVDGQEFTTIEKVVAAPTNLQVGEVTENTAVLTWEGETTSYEVTVGDNTQTVDAKTFTASSLSAETAYTWRVRAKDNDSYSAWVDGTSFTTKAEVGENDIVITAFDVPAANYYYGDEYSPGLSNNFHVTLYSEGTMSTGNGVMIKLDFHAPTSATTVIPDGVYPIQAAGVGGNQPMTLDDTYSWYRVYSESTPISSDEFASGNAEVSLSGDVYTIKFDFISYEDGIKVKGTYVGALTYTIPPQGVVPMTYNAGFFDWNYKMKAIR